MAIGTHFGLMMNRLWRIDSNCFVLFADAGRPCFRCSISKWNRSIEFSESLNFDHDNCANRSIVRRNSAKRVVFPIVRSNCLWEMDRTMKVGHSMHCRMLVDHCSMNQIHWPNGSGSIFWHRSEVLANTCKRADARLSLTESFRHWEGCNTMNRIH